MKKIFIKTMTVLALLVFLVGGMATGKSEAASNTANQDLIIINKYYNKLAYYHNGYLEMVVPVATGKKWDQTPIGFFKVVNKIKNRPYYTGNIPGGDPRNPLGNRWLGINANGTYGDTYAIHGNNNESSIGKYVSLGCVRMHNADVEKLYDKVQVGTPVNITYSYRSFKALTKVYGYDFKGYNTKN
ncbi:L,D-transpeptidase [Priestia endophytica]|uniref:L,D-transpeptidase n=1 Tax=Priestia endophytica TaxID=135735 RepID=UPI00227ED458|nr:L,D-transpeptidase [Priestia endophytica]MCY8234185.1 L,D-transpeptidase [Priestia endophytica]